MVMGEFTQEVDLLVVGGGPGGYAAAFRAADLGLDVAVVDSAPRLGGICLAHGCIPSKALLSLSELLHDVRHSAGKGVSFGRPEVDLAQVRAWKDGVVDKLADGLMRLAEKRGVQFLQARAVFEDSNRVRLEGGEISQIHFRQAILATGSTAEPLPAVPFRENGRVMGPTEALALRTIPARLLVIGGGTIGLELGSIYAALGSDVVLIESGRQVLAHADADLARPLARRIGRDVTVALETQVISVEEDPDGVEVVLSGKKDSERRERFDRVLVALGRRPNTTGIGLETTQVVTDGDGSLRVDEQQRTADPAILAVGDITGPPWLAHKALRQGKVAAEVAAGEPAGFDVRVIPRVVYTDPQLAWAGLTEREAQERNMPVEVARFPWGASGRAETLAADGLTKIISDPKTGRVVGVGIVGRHASEMIGEGALAIEMGALAEDLALTMHPHPSLSEATAEAAEVFLGSVTHILPPRRR